MANIKMLERFMQEITEEQAKEKEQEKQFIKDCGFENVQQLALDYIGIKQENERLKQNQLKVLNRIRDFINTSKCEIIEGSYCNDMHSQYWKMFIQFAEELKKKIKGIDTKDYVYIPKWREQELLSQEEQLDDYKSRIEKAVEILKRYTDNESNYYVPVFELIDILNGKE